MIVCPLDGWKWFEVTGSVKYLVCLGERPYCECADFSFRKRECKHLKACKSFGVSIK